MERVTFLIERTGDRISCLLNPESLEARRTAGLARRRTATGSVLGNPRTDDPLIPTGGGITEYDLQLLFDVDLANEGRGARKEAMPPVQSIPALTDLAEPADPEAAVPDTQDPPTETPFEPLPEPIVALTGDDADETAASPEPLSATQPPPPTDRASVEPPPLSPEQPSIMAPTEDPTMVADVRELTQPLWALAETGGLVDGALVQPRVRFIWGKSWNVPGVVTAVAERLERFDLDGVPRRSWLSLRLRRVEEDPEGVSAAPPALVTSPQFLLDRPAAVGAGPAVRSMPVPVGPDGRPMMSAFIVAYEIYGDPSLHLAICEASGIDNPLSIREGQRYILLPVDQLPPAAAQGETGQWRH